MTERFRITLGQINPTAGDLTGNAALAQDVWAAGRDAGADLVALPEMFLPGQNDGRLRDPGFVRETARQLEALAKACADGPALALGAPWQEKEALFNAYLILQDGKLQQRVLKHDLRPEERVLFTPGPISGPVVVSGLRIGCPIGTDAFLPDVAETLEETGAEILLVPDAAPYHRDAMDQRLNHMVARVVETSLPLIHLNRTGGEDHALFDGASFALNPGGRLARQLPAFADTIAHVDLDHGAEGWRIVLGDIAPQGDTKEKDYRALVEGLRDQLRKKNAGRAVLSLASDANSALVAVAAADAVGPENLFCALFADIETTAATQANAEALTTSLGCSLHNADLSPITEQIAETLDRSTVSTDSQLSERLRGLLLQTLADTLDALPLSTARRPELPSDLPFLVEAAGLYAPARALNDEETLALCHWRNSNHRGWMKGPSGEVVPAVYLVN